MESKGRAEPSIVAKARHLAAVRPGSAALVEALIDHLAHVRDRFLPAALLNTRDAARHIGMSTWFLRARRVGRGTDAPPYVRIGRSVRYSVTDLDAWLNRKRAGRPEHRLSQER